MRVRVRKVTDMREIIAQAMARTPRIRPFGSPDGAEGDPVPVRPDRPLDLSGGAAAALEFGD